jgi:hypothetical protein
MGTNKSKVKGSRFEHDAVEILTQLVSGSKFKRIPGSGAIGTTLGESLLTGDIVGIIDNYPQRFKGECKVGYNSSTNKEVKQFTLKKEWLDKIFNEAQGTYSLPFLIGKFDNARAGTKVFVVLDVEVFAELINKYTDLQKGLIDSEKLTIDKS